MVQGTLQGALLSPAKHSRVNGDLHTPLAAQPHSLFLADHLTLILIWMREDKQKLKKVKKTEMEPKHCGEVIYKQKETGPDKSFIYCNRAESEIVFRRGHV